MKSVFSNGINGRGRRENVQAQAKTKASGGPKQDDDTSKDGFVPEEDSLPNSLNLHPMRNFSQRRKL
ncbi:hypothetical protein SUGI_0143840 [Cryptomeria japonica]|nr:hypothetical protein SUGI_0143840 [Cryptomeria japonica]